MTTRRLLAVAITFVASVAHAQQPLVTPPGTADARPTVAVLYFTNGALVGNADYAPLSKGMAEMMITELARNPAIRVVERDRLQQILAEQNLGSGDRVDKETAVRLGKVLGAHHLVMGSFVIDPRQAMRIDVRSVNTETSQVEYVETIEGKTDRLLPMIGELGAKVNAGLKLPQLPARAPVIPASSSNGQNQFRAMVLMSRALEQQDRGNPQAAIALYRNAIEAAPGFEHAKTLLASLESGATRKSSTPCARRDVPATSGTSP
jgi:TolB-like protein